MRYKYKQITGAHFFVAHIAKNLAHQDGNYVTWCGIHVKKVFKMKTLCRHN